MKKSLIEKLQCPASKSKLLLLYSHDEIEDDIVSGLLASNSSKKYYYPVVNGIPRILSNSLQTFQSEVEEYIENLDANDQELIRNSFILDKKLKKDVLKTQNSFSSEWSEVNDDSHAWGRSPEIRLGEFKSRMEIDLPDLKNKLILDAGCGNGEVELGLKDSGAEIFAIDLSFSVDSLKDKISKIKTGNGTIIHLIQSDIINSPIQDNLCDFVFSDGVIHHTRSVYEGLKGLTSKVSANGKCFVFVYSHDHKKILDRITYHAYRIMRLLTLKIPHKLLHLFCYFLAPIHWCGIRIVNFILRKEKYKLRSIRETELSIFDSLSPVYDWRTSYKDLSSWFKEFGYANIKKTYHSHVGIGVLGTMNQDNKRN